MNYIRHLNAFFKQIKDDDRLTAIHVSLYLALFQYWNLHRFQNPFPVYRANLLQLSKLGSKNTYHKAIKELAAAGYIVYHPAPARYLPVKISLLRLDIKESGGPGVQLELFPSADRRQSPDHHPGPQPGPGRAGEGPDLGPPGPKTGTGTVPKPGPSLKPANGKKNSVYHPRTTEPEGAEGPQKPGTPPQVPDSGPVVRVSLHEVRAFFREQYQPAEEADRFFYYNQSRNWMLTDKVPVYDWTALAQKWILNIHNHADNPGPALSREIQYLYERFCEGQRVARFLRPEFFDHLRLQTTDTDLQNAWQRRINQLSGNPEPGSRELWQAYMSGDPQHPLVRDDHPQFIALAKRIAVHRLFQQRRAAGKIRLDQSNTES